MNYNLSKKEVTLNRIGGSEVDFSISELFQLSWLMDEYRPEKHYRPSQRSGLSLVVSWRNWKWRVQWPEASRATVPRIWRVLTC